MKGKPNEISRFSIIVCGLIQVQYAFNNITNKSNLCVKFFVKVIRWVLSLIVVDTAATDEVVDADDNDDCDNDNLFQTALFRKMIGMDGYNLHLIRKNFFIDGYKLHLI